MPFPAALACRPTTSECVGYSQLVACLLFSWVSAPLLPLFPSPTAKHIANISVSLFFLLGVLRLYNGTLQLVCTALVVYLLVKFRVGGARMPWVVFVVQMGHMTFTHLYRQIADIPRTTLEISAMQMVLCMNLTMFAWDVHDGERPIEQCDEEQRQARLERLPSLLEFYGSALFYPSVLVGPSVRFADYAAWANGTLYGKHLPRGRLAASLSQLFVAAVALGLTAVVLPHFNYMYLIDPAHAVFAAPFLVRFAFMQVCGLMARTQYYGVWNLANAGCIASGMGYSGTDARGVAHWDRCRNISIIGVEFANNVKELSDSWNIHTAVWLKNYVYKRVTAPRQKAGSMSAMITFLVSALWHGLYPGYFLTFVYLWAVQQLVRVYRKVVRPIFYADVRTPNPTFATLSKYTPAQLAYSAVAIATNHAVINFGAAPFIALTMIDSVRIYSSVYWYGFVGIAASFIAVNLGVGRFLRRFYAVKPAKTQ